MVYRLPLPCGNSSIYIYIYIYICICDLVPLNLFQYWTIQSKNSSFYLGRHSCLPSLSLIWFWVLIILFYYYISIIFCSILSLYRRGVFLVDMYVIWLVGSINLYIHIIIYDTKHVLVEGYDWHVESSTNIFVIPVDGHGPLVN